jgi:hypothetical protein
MDLQSIYPATRTVPFLNGTVDVIGLSLRAATQLTIEFPILVALASGTADLAGLIVSGPDAALGSSPRGSGMVRTRTCLRRSTRHPLDSKLICCP